MPRQSQWIHKLPEICAVLEEISLTVLDKQQVAIIFGIGPRQATRLLHRLGAATIGGALLIERSELIIKLTKLGQTEAVVFEQRRHEKVSQQLEQARKEIRSRRLQISPVRQDSLEWSLLPEAIQLEPGELRIRFSNPVELLERMMLLGQMVAEDWIGFEKRTEAKVGAAQIQPRTQ